MSENLLRQGYHGCRRREETSSGARPVETSYHPRMDTTFFPVRIRVRYAETDQMGVVHHAVYPVWFEAARTELSRAVGLPYSRWEADGALLMVSDLVCRFRRPARYDDTVTVWARVAEVASRRVTFAYRVEGPDGSLLVEGETRHLLVERSTGRPMTFPPAMRASLLRVPAAASEP